MLWSQKFIPYFWCLDLPEFILGPLQGVFRKTLRWERKESQGVGENQTSWAGRGKIRRLSHNRRQPQRSSLIRWPVQLLQSRRAQGTHSSKSTPLYNSIKKKSTSEFGKKISCLYTVQYTRKFFLPLLVHEVHKSKNKLIMRVIYVNDRELIYYFPFNHILYYELWSLNPPNIHCSIFRCSIVL